MRAFLAGMIIALAAGGLLHLVGAGRVGDLVWAAGTAGAVPAAWWVIDALRKGRLGVDAIAALALVGTLIVREYLAGAIIAVMLASGRVLEEFALRRAKRDLTALRERAPRSARRSNPSRHRPATTRCGAATARSSDA